ncbi:MAG: hypothetical protein P9L94_16725 [Candidatus Hinthialibacter antarcticus]|nr:hypothetical protein [Candidatus Hinthialibacter antarcticus]
MTKQESLILGVLLVLVLAILLLRYQWIDHSTTMQWGYVNSGAVNPYYGVNRPYGYRLLMSAFLNLAGVVPKPGEGLIPITFAVGLCLSFYGFLRGIRFDWPLASLGALLLCCSNGMIDLLKDFGINNTDTSSHILLLASFWAMAAGRDSLFSAFTLIGVFNREWALVMLPTWYLFHFGFSLSKTSIIRLVRVSAPSILVFLLIRFMYYPNIALGVMASELQDILPPTEAPTWAYYWFELQQSSLSIFGSRIASVQFYEFGLIGLAPFAVGGFLRVSAQWRRAIAFYGALCVLQLYFTTDVWRLAFYLFPVMLGLYLVWLKRASDQMNGKFAVIFCAGASVVIVLLQHSLWMILIGTLMVLAAQAYHSSGKGCPNK